MTRVMQCLFVLGMLFIVAGIVQEIRLKSMGARHAVPLQTIPMPPSAPLPVSTQTIPIPTSEPLPLPPQPIPSPRPAPKPKRAPKPVVPISIVGARHAVPLQQAVPHPPTPIPVAPPPQKGDFDPSLLKKDMPKPVQVPTDVELPKVVAENGQWIGSQCGITEPIQTVFRNESDWKAFWSKAIAPYSSALRDVPVIDFTKEMIVGVFMGTKPLPGYQIRIIKSDVQEEGQDTVGARHALPLQHAVPRLIVQYKNIDRFLGIFTPSFEVQPFHLLRLNTFPGKVTFIQVKENKK